MTTEVAHASWQSLNTLFSVGTLGGLSDTELLKCFRNDRDAGGQEAFRILVERHGPMVWGLCRSVIPDPHEAEDAFLATFLVLVRKGHAIWVRDSVGPWLYGVATRVARRARRRAVERGRRQVALVEDVVDPKASGPASRVHDRETDRVIHEEVARLAASLREPIVLCTLEGLTYDAAARQLGVTEATLRGRLRRARRRLASRLRERGITSPRLGKRCRLLGIVPVRIAGTALPETLVKSTVQHAALWSSISGLVGDMPA